MAGVEGAEECARQLREFEDGIPEAILDGMEIGALAMLKISVTDFFDGGGGSPNPPPGPLKIRSGDLRRGIQIVQPARQGNNFLSGLQVIGVPYGRTHELGLGRFPARPFLQPAMEKGRPLAVIAIVVELENLGRRIGLNPR